MGIHGRTLRSSMPCLFCSAHLIISHRQIHPLPELDSRSCLRVSPDSAPACFPAMAGIAYRSKAAAWFILIVSFPFLALPAFFFLALLAFTCLSGLGTLCVLRYALRLWNPRIEEVMRERALRKFRKELKQASVGEDGSLWDEGWLRWARAGAEGLRQLRVHQYLEDQLNHVGVFEGDTDHSIGCASEGGRSVEDDCCFAKDAQGRETLRGMASSEDEDDAVVCGNIDG